MTESLRELCTDSPYVVVEHPITSGERHVLSPTHGVAPQFHLGETGASDADELIIGVDPVREAEAIADELKRGKTSVLKAAKGWPTSGAYIMTTCRPVAD